MTTPIQRRARNISHYLRAYGSAYGLWIYLRLRVGRRGTLVSLYPPGAKMPTTVRRGTVDVGVWDEVFISRDYDVSKMNPEPDLIVDGGANIGLTSIYYALRYPNAKIVAVEPDSDNFRLLQHNATAYPNIHPIQAAMWHRDTKVSLNNPTQQSVSFQCEEAEGPGAIGTVTVAGLLRQHEGRQIDLLKLDVEGAEKSLFEESTDWIDRVRTFAIEFHDRKVPGCVAAFNRALGTQPHQLVAQGGNVIVYRLPA